MSYGSFIQTGAQAIIAALESGEATAEQMAAAAKEIRDETKRADNNAAKIRELNSQMEGMKAVVGIYAAGRG